MWRGGPGQPPRLARITSEDQDKDQDQVRITFEVDKDQDEMKMRTGGSDPNQHHVSLLFVMTGWRDDLGGGCANQNSGKAAPVNQPLLAKLAFHFSTATGQQPTNNQMLPLFGFLGIHIQFSPISRHCVLHLSQLS